LLAACALRGRRSLSLHDQGAQITRNDFSWSTLGTPATMTYAFRASAPTSPPAGVNEAVNFSRFNANEILAIKIALQEWSDVARIQFVEVGGGDFTDNATMLFSNFRTPAISSGHAYLPATSNTAPTSPEGDTWLNLNASPYNNFGFGSYDFSTVVHEVGHAKGLFHPGD
jgi:serralysin